MRMKQVVVVFSIIVCGAGMVMGQTEWVDDPENPLFGPGNTGPWDASGPWARAVVFDGSMYHLWFTGSSQGGAPTDMGHATSTDGVEWTLDPGNPVLIRGGSGEWDSNRLDGAAVIHDGMLFHMWYSGWGTGGYERVGYATSPDGTFWTKHTGNPVMDVGAAGTFDDELVRPTAVVLDGGTYKMWYGGCHYSTGPFVCHAGYAESSDGITWSKRQDPVLSPSDDPTAWDFEIAANPYVIFDGATYHMWFSGASANHWSIGYAFSSDGIEWTKYSDNPVVSKASEDTFHSPVFNDGTIWRMLYTNAGSEYQISQATSDCCPVAVIFSDGFENGDTSEWSAVVP